MPRKAFSTSSNPDFSKLTSAGYLCSRPIFLLPFHRGAAMTYASYLDKKTNLVNQGSHRSHEHLGIHHGRSGHFPSHVGLAPVRGPKPASLSFLCHNSLTNCLLELFSTFSSSCSSSLTVTSSVVMMLEMRQYHQSGQQQESGLSGCHFRYLVLTLEFFSPTSWSYGGCPHLWGEDNYLWHAMDCLVSISSCH